MLNFFFASKSKAIWMYICICTILWKNRHFWCCSLCTLLYLHFISVKVYLQNLNIILLSPSVHVFKIYIYRNLLKLKWLLYWCIIYIKCFFWNIKKILAKVKCSISFAFVLLYMSWFYELWSVGKEMFFFSLDNQIRGES